MKQTAASSAATPTREISSGIFLGIAVLAFVSLILFGLGLLLHRAPSSSAAAKPIPAKSVPIKSASRTHQGKSKAAPKTAALKNDAPITTSGDSPAFPLLFAGGFGLLLSAIAGLALSHSLRVSQPKAVRRLLEAEHAARWKQQGDFEAEQAAMQAQLSDAKQRKAETEALREQVSRQFQEFFRTLPVPCFCFAANGRIIRWNAACETLYGIPASTALESTLWETIVPDSEREDMEVKLSRVLSGESLLTMERWDCIAGGGMCRLRCSMVPLYDAEGAIIGGLSAGVDMTEFAGNEQQIAALTGELETLRAAAQEREAASSAASMAAIAPVGSAEISGHSAFRTRLAEEVERSARYHTPLSLVILDLDSFAARNQAYGFAAGDQALQSAVTVIQSKIRTVDVIARLGADEYAVILPETGEAGARVAADRLRTGIAGASIYGQPPQTACFGITQLTPEVSGPEELITRALESLASAKSCGASTLVHFQDLPEVGIPSSAHPPTVKPRMR